MFDVDEVEVLLSYSLQQMVHQETLSNCQCLATIRRLRKSAILSRCVCHTCLCHTLVKVVFENGASVDASVHTSLSWVFRVDFCNSACVRIRIFCIKLFACLFDVALVTSLYVLNSLSCISLLRDLKATIL